MSARTEHIHHVLIALMGDLESDGYSVEEISEEMVYLVMAMSHHLKGDMGRPFIRRCEDRIEGVENALEWFHPEGGGVNANN
jgi:hypothetical protein